ncbi:MAG: PAS domain-containing protein, partial [Stellaceae bacterium]
MDQARPAVLAGSPFPGCGSLDQAIESWVPALNAVPAPVAIYDRAGTLAYRNIAAERLWAATQMLPAAVGEALHTGQPVRDRQELIECADGSHLAIVVNADPLRDRAGLVIGAICCASDDRKPMAEARLLSEQRLREFNSTLGTLGTPEQQADERARLLASSRAQLQAFFDNSPDWLTLQRVGHDGSAVYLDINPTCEIAYGLRRDQVVGRRLEEIIGPEAAVVPNYHIRECVRTGRSQRYVARRTMAGRTRTIDVVVTPVPGAADERGQLIITTARDITESEELEAQLRQAQKMEVVGQLTGGLAHDFNNLLAAILGNLELLEMRVAGDARAARQVQAAQRSALRGAKLTEQLLAFSRRQH